MWNTLKYVNILISYYHPLRGTIGDQGQPILDLQSFEIMPSLNK